MKKEYIKGIVEGFYGRPWDWQERKDLLTAMTGKYNLYIYAPKEDNYHRDLWRETYPEAFMNLFEELVTFGKERAIDISLALSPGLSLIHSDEKDLNIVCDKFMRFADRGVTTFCLFFDDIPETLIHPADKERFSSLADGQSYFTNKVYERLINKIPNFRFIMCPTLYFGEEVNEYHHELGQKLFQDIEIMWTGPKVCSEKLETSEAKMISGVFKRPVLYWDNYPVNDSAMAPELHIGPYMGRDGDLYRHSSGIVLNPMSRAYASMISLNTAGEYFEKRETFDALNSWKSTIKKMAPACHEAFLEFALANQKSPICPDDSQLLRNILQTFKSLYTERRRDEAGEHLIKTGRHIRENAEKIEKELDAKLLADIKMWLDEYNHWGETLCLVGDVVLADLSMYREDTSEENLNNVAARDKKLEDHLKQAVEFNTTVLGDELFTFALDRLRISKGLVTMYRY